MANVSIFKELAVIEDLDLGMGSSIGSRGGSQINATKIPYSNTNTIAEELDTKATKSESDNTYALKNGDASEEFAVASPLSADSATTKQYVDDGLADKPSLGQLVSDLSTRAMLNGNANEIFTVASPSYPAEPAKTDTFNFGYFEDWFNDRAQTQIDKKADKLTTLDTIVEHADYTPTAPMHPATKSYVDNKVVDIGAGDMAEATFVNADTASKAVYTTDNIGSFSSPMGISSSDEVMRLSTNILTDINDTAGFGIFVGAVDNISGDLPPADAGTNLILEQMNVNTALNGLSSVSLVAQRATTNLGAYHRVYNGSSFSTWKKAVAEEDIANYAYSKAEANSLNSVQDTQIEANKSGIATNKSGIATNKNDIATNLAYINTNQSRIATNKSNITTNTTNIASNKALANSKIRADQYATSTVGGTCKARRSGTTMYITFNGNNA